MVAGRARIEQRIDGYGVGASGVKRMADGEDERGRNQKNEYGQYSRPHHPSRKMPGHRRQTSTSPHPSNSAWRAMFCQAEFRPSD